MAIEKRKRDKKVNFRTTKNIIDKLEYLVNNDEFNRNKTQLMECFIVEHHRELILRKEKKNKFDK